MPPSSRHDQPALYGDNLDVLREPIPGENVDSIHLDPPLNSNANYNILFKSPVERAAVDSDAAKQAMLDL